MGNWAEIILCQLVFLMVIASHVIKLMWKVDTIGMFYKNSYQQLKIRVPIEISKLSNAHSINSWRGWVIINFVSHWTAFFKKCWVLICLFFDPKCIPWNIWPETSFYYTWYVTNCTGSKSAITCCCLNLIRMKELRGKLNHLKSNWKLAKHKKIK